MNRRTSSAHQPAGSSKPRKNPVPPKRPPQHGEEPQPCLSAAPKKAGRAKGGFHLHGDVKALEFAFVETRRRLVGTTVPESVFLAMQKHPGSVSGFYEDAVAAFDGDLTALVNAAVQFVKQRKLRAVSDPIRNANGRVYATTFNRIQEIEKALASIRGMSRAKVLAGLIQVFFNHVLPP